MKPEQVLRTAADTIEARAALRDRGQERSMARTVKAFNALTGHELSETDGWVFMVMLKLGREQSGHDPDNFVDGTAFMALAGESADVEKPAAPGAAVPVAPSAPVSGGYVAGRLGGHPGAKTNLCNGG